MINRDAPTVGPNAELPSPTAPPDPLIGALVADRYRVLERIGEGGMGAVYVAEHVALHKKIALKTLHADMHANAEVRARFEREALAMAKLEHENVVSATDFGQLDDGTFFLAMEYIEGKTLRELTAESPKMPTLRALKILRQIASALTRAHAQGIVHRDLKPENVLIVRRSADEELVKIIDFGIARMTSATDSDKPLTQTGVVFGTPHYMAPEQALGRRVDAAADQYAFGVLAFELLTGRKPFDHKNLIELLELHVSAPIPRATEVNVELPPAVDAVFDRLLAKSPIERFATVSDGMESLDAALVDLVARQSSVSITTESAGSVQHEHTILASMGAGALSTASGPATVSDAAPTVQDGPSPAAFRAPVAPMPTRIAGLPVVTMGRLGKVPVVGVLIVAASFVFSVAALVRSIPSASSKPRSTSARDEAPVERRIDDVRHESEVSAALARAARGETAEAIDALRARRARQPAAPDDGIVAYQLGLLLASAGRSSEAVSTFADAVARDPALVEDEALVRALTRLLSDPVAGNAADTLLHAATFAGSRAAARVLAEETIFGRTQEARRRAGRLARERIALLDPVQRARVLLRTSDRCDELTSVVTQITRLGPGPASDDLARIRAGQCGMLLRRSLCQCLAER